MNKNGIKEDKAMMNIKSIKSLAFLLMVGCAFVSCSSNDTDDFLNGNDKPTGVKSYTLIVNASKGNDAFTRALSLSGSTLSATWSVGDEVKVYNGGTEIGTLTAQNSGTSTTLTGSLTTTPNVNDELTLKFLSPDYSTQDGTLEYIAANCDYATATVTVSTVNTTEKTITTTGNADFQNQQAVVKLTLTDNAATPAAMNVSKLTISADGYAYSITPLVTTNVLFVAIPSISNKTINLYATDGNNTYIYSKSSVSFTNGKYYAITVKMKPPTAPDGVEAIDLDLPSGTLWANMNVGATAPEEFGDYFAWGETIPKNTYDWGNYLYGDGSTNNLIKYCLDDVFGTVDNKSMLESSDDAATANWGEEWRMPTIAEIEELINNTTSEWSNLNGVDVMKLTSKNNGKTLFLPRAGNHDVVFNSNSGCYWSSSIMDIGDNDDAYILNFLYNYRNVVKNNYNRFYGCSIRPVRKN